MRGCSRYAAAKPECERSFIACTATTCCAVLGTARSFASPLIVPGRLPPYPLRLPLRFLFSCITIWKTPRQSQTAATGLPLGHFAATSAALASTIEI
jgi:hypothetical protein